MIATSISPALPPLIGCAIPGGGGGAGCSISPGLGGAGSNCGISPAKVADASINVRMRLLIIFILVLLEINVLTLRKVGLTCLKTIATRILPTSDCLLRKRDQILIRES